MCFPGLKTFESADVSTNEADPEPEAEAQVDQKGKNKPVTHRHVYFDVRK